MSNKIKNIGVFAHVDAGKTTITEHMLYISGKIRKVGSVDTGTTHTDWLSIERERGISVKAAATEIEWNDYLINLIDTPGHIDFAGEVERSLMALDGAVLIVSAVEGIQSHTENLWRAFQELKIPCIIFINKIDRAGSNVKQLFNKFEQRLKGNFILLCEAINEESKDCNVDSIIDKPYFFEELTLKLANIYDDIADFYFAGKQIKPFDLDTFFKQSILEQKLTPVLCGSAQLGIGIKYLMNAITEFLPSANSENVDELSALIFKIEHDKSMGKIAHVRMFGGKIKNRDVITVNHDTFLANDNNKDIETPGEKITQIRKFNGSKYIDIGEVKAGNIAALYGLTSAKTGDYIGTYSKNHLYKLANPFLTVKVSPKSQADLPSLVNAIKELSDEDPIINYKWEKSEREININLTGEIQLEVINILLKERYNLTANFSPPSVIYKETPSKSGEGFEAYTMPKPCWAVVKFSIEPLPRGSGVVYEGTVQNNKLFYKYQSHIKTSFFTSLEQGMFGWEITDLKVTLIDGEHHTMHTHPLDFFVATPMALMNGLANTGTTLLEPMLNVRITAGDEFLGKIISDIIVMRGQFDNPVISHNSCTIEAKLPVATSMKYPIRLAALTGGKAIFSSTFGGYQECPIELGATAQRRGINPLDRAKWILYARGAIQ